MVQLGQLVNINNRLATDYFRTYHESVKNQRTMATCVTWVAAPSTVLTDIINQLHGDDEPFQRRARMCAADNEPEAVAWTGCEAKSQAIPTVAASSTCCWRDTSKRLIKCDVNRCVVLLSPCNRPRASQMIVAASTVNRRLQLQQQESHHHHHWASSLYWRRTLHHRCAAALHSTPSRPVDSSRIGFPDYGSRKGYTSLKVEHSHALHIAPKYLWQVYTGQGRI